MSRVTRRKFVSAVVAGAGAAFAFRFGADSAGGTVRFVVPPYQRGDIVKVTIGGEDVTVMVQSVQLGSEGLWGPKTITASIHEE